MTSINLSIPRPGNERGEIYHQKSFQSADLTTADTDVVPAVAGKLAVIDKLVISFGGAQTFQLLAGTDTLLDAIYGAANTTVTLDVPVRSDTVNEAIGFHSSASGNISFFVIYHYETPTADAVTKYY